MTRVSLKMTEGMSPPSSLWVRLTLCSPNVLD